VLYIDDPLDVGAVHCFCGAWGLVVTAALASRPLVVEVYGEDTADAGFGVLSMAANTDFLHGFVHTYCILFTIPPKEIRTFEWLKL
jgi:ammonia channel protein AmtB